MGLKFAPKSIENFSEVDLTDLSMPTIAIYKNPKDYPGKCVARVWTLNRPTDVIMIRNTTKELEKEVKEAYPGAISIPRCGTDDKCLVETYIL